MEECGYLRLQRQEYYFIQMIDFEKELNEQQRAVVKTDPGPILVIAPV